MNNFDWLLRAIHNEDQEAKDRLNKLLTSLPLTMFVTEVGKKQMRQSLLKRLKVAGITTLGDLLRGNDNDLGRYKGIGWKRIDLLQASLQRYGLSIQGPSHRPFGTKVHFGAKWTS